MAVIPLFMTKLRGVFAVFHHTVAVVCNAMCMCQVGLSSPVSLRGITSPKPPLIFVVAMVKKMFIPDHVIGFPNLSVDSQNRILRNQIKFPGIKFRRKQNHWITR